MPNKFNQSDYEDATRKEMIMPIPPRKTTTPKEDEAQLAEMGLSPVIKAEIVPVKQQNEIPERKKTIQESRDESVMKLLEKAYENASQLKLTADEQKALLEDFPDYCFQRGANGDNNLLYLEHEALRNRLSNVLGLGQWKQVIRRNWEEEFTSGNPPSVSKRIYIDMVLLVRGCVVAEAIGNGVYMPKNPRDTYGDGFEKAKTNAFRLCCKEWGLGLQCYSKDWCEAFKARYPGFERPPRPQK